MSRPLRATWRPTEADIRVEEDVVSLRPPLLFCAVAGTATGAGLVRASPAPSGASGAVLQSRHRRTAARLSTAASTPRARCFTRPCFAAVSGGFGAAKYQ